jgi:hypothetical protein
LRRNICVAFVVGFVLVFIGGIGINIMNDRDAIAKKETRNTTPQLELDPYPHNDIDPTTERVMTDRNQNFRKAVAAAIAVDTQKAIYYVSAVEQAEQEERHRLAEEQQRAQAAAVEHYIEEDSEEPSRNDVSSEPSSGRCGGDLPDCSIMECESGGSLTAQNPSSSASGKWQVIDGTWNNYGGYDSAAEAPEDVQDAKARELWAGGSGASHWEQCR